MSQSDVPRLVVISCRRRYVNVMIVGGDSQVGIVVDLAKMQKLTELDGVDGVGEVDLRIHHLVHKLVLGIKKGLGRVR